MPYSDVGGTSIGSTAVRAPFVKRTVANAAVATPAVEATRSVAVVGTAVGVVGVAVGALEFALVAVGAVGIEVATADASGVLEQPANSSAPARTVETVVWYPRAIGCFIVFHRLSLNRLLATRRMPR